MYRPAPRPLTLVFPTRALPLKDDSASASRSGDGAAAGYRGRPAMHGRLEITKRNPVAAKACDLITPVFQRPSASRSRWRLCLPPASLAWAAAQVETLFYAGSEEDQRTPSFESIVLPTATRLGASVAAGISMFNEKAEILSFCSTHPVHQPRFGALENRHPVLP
jgi:hypothetical protein